MAKFRKKRVVIEATVVEATQWFKNGDGAEENLKDWNFGGARACEQCGHRMDAHGDLDTLKDGESVGLRVCPGDWIITPANGERYPVKPDDLAQRFELIEAQ